nr:hypothetical protein CFP56_56418 [Quercus suber]
MALVGALQIVSSHVFIVSMQKLKDVGGSFIRNASAFSNVEHSSVTKCGSAGEGFRDSGSAPGEEVAEMVAGFCAIWLIQGKKRHFSSFMLLWSFYTSSSCNSSI